jgi:hypothetical protein
MTTETETRKQDEDPYEGMSTDRAYLEKLADWLDGKIDDKDFEHTNAPRKVRAIAIGCDQLMLEKQRLTSLEEKVDQKLCDYIELAFGFRQGEYELSHGTVELLQVAATWLLSRRTQSAGTRAMFGSGMGTLGAVALAKLFETEGSK